MPRTKKPHITKWRERKTGEAGFSIEIMSGPHDGHILRQVVCTTNQGKELMLFKSNVHKGFFKAVFVPWDFEHADIIHGT